MGMIVSPLTQGLRYRAACDMIDALRGLHFHIVNPSRDFLSFFPAYLWRSDPLTDFDAKWLKRRTFTQGWYFCSKNRNFSYPL